MLAYIIRRIWQMIPTMLGVVLLIFFLFNWVGGDPAYILAGKMSNPEQIENIRQQLGIDHHYDAFRAITDLIDPVGGASNRDLNHSCVGCFCGSWQLD